MDYCSGGELFYHLQKKGKLPENDCKFLTFEILLALQYLHSNFIVYRDLKVSLIINKI